jgi:hypothetical protein
MNEEDVGKVKNELRYREAECLTAESAEHAEEA